MYSSTALFAADASSPEQVAELLHRADVALGPAHRVVRTVLDTFDGLLHDAGLQLTLIEESGRRTVTLDGQDVVAVRAAVPAAPVWPADLPPGPLRSRVAAVVELRALQPVLRIETHERRAARIDSRRKEIAQATLIESGTIEPGAVALAPTPLVEVTELAGYEKPASEIVAALARRNVRRLEEPFVELAARRAGVDLAGFSSSPSVQLDPTMTALDGWCAVLANLLATARANWAGTIAQVDTEFLHELRVAVRRSRSILGHAKGIIPPDVLEPARRLFAAIGTATGPARDYDVQLLGWPEHASQLGSASAAELQPVHDLLEERHHRAHAELDAELTDPAVHAELDEWARWLADRHRPAHPTDAPLAAERLGPVVAKRIRKAYRTVIDDGRPITVDSPAESLHDLRKEAKKLRYLLECFAGVLPSTERKNFVRSLKVLQDNLGEHQDAAVHVEELRAIGEAVHAAGAPAGTMFALGELSAHIDDVRAAARDEFAARFAEFDTKETRQAFEAMLAGLDENDT